MTDADDEKFRALVERLRKRLKWISGKKARSALIGGLAAQGDFQIERDRIIKRTDEVLNEWAALINARSVSE